MLSAVGFTKTDPSNWTHDGFAPFGVDGIFAGASNLFVAFIGGYVTPERQLVMHPLAGLWSRWPVADVPVSLCGLWKPGFDLVATSAEEAQRPKRDVPLASFITLGICTTVYILMVSVYITQQVACNMPDCLSSQSSCSTECSIQLLAAWLICRP